MKISSPAAPTSGSSTYVFQELPETGRPAAAIADRAEILYRQTGDLHGSVKDTRRRAHANDLESRRAAIAKNTPLVEALDRLSDYGFAWRDVARVLGVSVAAVNKWRRGTTGTTGQNRLKVAKLMALIEMLKDRWVNEPASWLEMPFCEGVAISPLDLLANDRYDLVLDLASAAAGEDAAHAVLEEFDSNWRDTYVDSAFEAFTAEDGAISIRPRGI